MNKITLILSLFSFINLYSQIDFRNYTNTKEFLNFSKLDSNDFNINQNLISVGKNYNFKDSFSDYDIIKVLESIISEHNKLVHNERMKTIYSEKELAKIDSLKIINIPNSYKYKIIAKYHPNNATQSLLVLQQKNAESLLDGRQLLLYLLNFNNNLLISSALIGRYEKVKSLSFVDANTKVSIDKNTISIRDRITLIPSDICQNCKKKDYTDKYEYVFKIKEDGQIQRIK